MKDAQNNELSIILPVFNERDVIEKVILDIHACASRLVVDLEMIAVNDGSTDGTEEILTRLSCSLPNLKVVSHQMNVGYGGALISGIRAAQKTWILLTDSDGQIEINSLQVAWPLRDDHDVVLGYREKRADNVYRRMMGRLGNSVS
ncbi:MAG: glycosyltransferase family 2 protein, partial [Candidatus Omnitrophica bacterium]|nr:glycosyltransferase family 2 protein [Candidatus Omnitrophota bacterium]